MNPTDFVTSLKIHCRDSAVSDCISLFENPPGLRVTEAQKRLSDWFAQLSAMDRKFVIAAMGEAADLTLFGVLCVIDGVRTIEPIGEKSEFTLMVSRSGQDYQISPSESHLHDLLRSD